MNRLLAWTSPKDRSRWGTYWRVILFWNPLVAAVITLLFDSDELVLGMARSTLIGSVAATTCFATGWVIEQADIGLRRARGRGACEHGLGWHISVSALGLPLGLFLGFHAVGLAFGEVVPGIEEYGMGMMVGGIVLLAFVLHETHHDLREAQHLAALREKETENERLRGQIAALTAQMNPHLLFNALNTIASLAQEQPDAAEETTVELAGLYRGVLDASRREVHPLSAELELCRSYLAIEHARFGDRLGYAIEVDDGIDPARVVVPPLLVQPLVENAVKHGIAPRAEGGRVVVRVGRVGDDITVRVEDDGVGFDPARASERGSTGLANCRTRLRLLYSERASFDVAARDAGGTLARLSLPADGRESAT